MKIKIDKLGVNGEGVCRINSGDNKDKVCFVDFLLPDEIADIEIVKDTRSFCKGKVLHLEKKSPQRVNPICPYFEKCGGCDIQHLDKSLQLEFKKNIVEETIEKIAKIKVVASDTVRLNDYNYRNKMVFPVEYKNNKIVIGMYEAGTHKIVEINECKIANENINLILKNTQEFFDKNTDEDFKFLRSIVVRVYGGKAIITFVVKKKINIEKYYANLQKLPILCGLSMVIGDNDKDRLSGKYIAVNGSNTLEIDEFGIKYAVDNLGFMQVNNDVKIALYNEVVNLLDSNSIVVDGYCGAGLLTAIMSKKCKKVIGVDIVKSSINSAKNLMVKNGICNAEFYCGDFKNELSKILINYNNICLVLDPPRQGCDKEILEKILEQNKLKDTEIKKVIYISCNPATLARDLEVLKQDYDIAKLIPFDMFPQTRHIETLVCLQKRV